MKFFPTGPRVNNAETIIHVCWIEQLIKCVGDGESQVSHCWGGNLEKTKGTRLECGEGLEFETDNSCLP